MARSSLIFLLLISLLGAVACARTRRDLSHFNNINPSLLEIQRINIVSHHVFNFFNTNPCLQGTHFLTVDCASAPPAIMGAQYLARPIAPHKTQTTDHDYTLSIVRVLHQGVGQPPTDPAQTKSASSAYVVSDLVKRCLISVLILILILLSLVQLICAIKGRNTAPPAATPIFQVMNMDQYDLELRSNAFILQRAPLAVQHSHGNTTSVDAEVEVTVTS